MSRFVYRPPFRSQKHRFLTPGLAIPAADFFVFVRPTQAPAVVQFIDLSEFHGPPLYTLEPLGGKPTSWLWDFGDGSPASIVQNPQHLYENPGSYTVSLTACNNAGCDTLVRQSYIQLSLTGSVSISMLNDSELLSGSIRPGSGVAADFSQLNSVTAKLKMFTAAKVVALRDSPRTSAKLRSTLSTSIRDLRDKPAVSASLRSLDV